MAILEIIYIQELVSTLIVTTSLGLDDDDYFARCLPLKKT